MDSLNTKCCSGKMRKFAQWIRRKLKDTMKIPQTQKICRKRAVFAFHILHFRFGKSFSCEIVKEKEKIWWMDGLSTLSLVTFFLHRNPCGLFQMLRDAAKLTSPFQELIWFARWLRLIGVVQVFQTREILSFRKLTVILGNFYWNCCCPMISRNIRFSSSKILLTCEWNDEKNKIF